AVQQRLMEAGTVLEHAKSVSDSTTATQVKVNEAIPQLQETINTTLKSVESAKSSALTIRTKRQDQVDEVNALVSKMHDEDVENRLKAANREHADFIEQQKQQAADEARTMKDGEIAQLKDRHGAALQEQADRHRTEKDALERQIQELEGNLAAYRQGTDPYGNQPPIGPVGTNPAAVPLYVTDDGTVISPPRQR
ncbi:MAG TPA: hypothetical protein VFL85_01085, partial [Candidatus Saccharimonadales bacterium]|nr:hypothetical protein [Candidatus Saccharimonadales bacterium]